MREGDRVELERLTRSSSVRAGVAQRARIVLLAAHGRSNTKITALHGVTRQTVVTWRHRYEQAGLAGLDDVPKPGRPSHVDQRRIIAATLKPPPSATAGRGLTGPHVRRVAVAAL